jgi:hypothetical protein
VEVATFTGPDASDPATEFAAQVNWGDGTPPDTTAVVSGSNGQYHVLGSPHLRSTGVVQHHGAGLARVGRSEVGWCGCRAGGRQADSPIPPIS